MSDDLKVGNIHSGNLSYGRWVVSIVYGRKSGAAGDEKAGAWVYSKTGSVTMIVDLNTPRQVLTEDFFDLTDLSDRGLFKGLLDQLPGQAKNDTDSES